MKFHRKSLIEYSLIDHLNLPEEMMQNFRNRISVQKCAYNAGSNVVKYLFSLTCYFKL